MITWQDVVDVFVFTGALFLISSAIFLLTYVVIKVVSKWKSVWGTEQLLRGVWGGLPLGFTGIAAGFLTGSSRAPAVTALVPAILTFVGLSVVYLLGHGNFRALLAGIIVLMFSFNLLLGTFLGGVSRERFDQLSLSLAALEISAEKEFALRRYRTGLGLPADPPRRAVPALESDKP